MKDVWSGYVERSASHFSAMHYVPSFNDLNSMSNEDVELRETLLAAESNGKQDQRTETWRDQDRQVVMRPQAPKVLRARSEAVPKASRRSPLGTSLDPMPDIHHVDTAASHYDSSKGNYYDSVREPNREPSVWEIIDKSKNPSPRMFEPMETLKDAHLKSSVSVVSPDDFATEAKAREEFNHFSESLTAGMITQVHNNRELKSVHRDVLLEAVCA